MNKGDMDHSVGTIPVDYAGEAQVQLRMSDGSYAPVDPNKSVVAIPEEEPKEKTKTEDKPRAEKFKVSIEWVSDVMCGKVPTGGVYVSTTLASGGGGKIGGGDEARYIVPIDDWNSHLKEAATYLYNTMRAESSVMRLSDNEIEDDPILGPLVALVT